MRGVGGSLPPWLILGKWGGGVVTPCLILRKGGSRGRYPPGLSHHDPDRIRPSPTRVSPRVSVISPFLRYFYRRPSNKFLPDSARPCTTFNPIGFAIFTTRIRVMLGCMLCLPRVSAISQLVISPDAKTSRRPRPWLGPSLKPTDTDR